MISLFCGLKKVIINQDLDIDDGFSIVKNPLNIEEIRDERTLISIGSIHHISLVNNPVLLQRLFFQDENLNPYDFIKMFKGVSQNLLLSIWLLKDNSINMDEVIYFDKKNGNIVTDKTPLLFSNSQGEYKNVYLTANEVKESLIWFERLFPHMIQESSSNKEKSRVIGTRINNNNKDIDYYNFDRLQRAVRFVVLARSESFPPAKITFYISALESLFSNSNDEVKMQVADRTSRVLGQVYEERIRINKIISIAYSFRSVYIHGSVNSQKTIRKTLKPYRTIEELSMELDDILRKVLKRFLTDLNYVEYMDDAEYSVWISELLYK